MATSDHELSLARTIAARLVEKFGSKYLPIWDVVNSEYERRQAMKETIKTKIADAARADVPRRSRRKGPLARDAQS